MEEIQIKKKREKLTDEQLKARRAERRRKRYNEDADYRKRQQDIVKKCHENNKEHKKAKEKEWYEAHKEERIEIQKERNKRSYDKIKLMKQKLLLIQNLSNII
jgi:hypothetical protein